MRRLRVWLLLSFFGVVLPLATAGNTASAPAQVLATKGAFVGTWNVVRCGEPVPPGSSDLFCLTHTADALVPGLGAVKLTFTTLFNYASDCTRLWAKNASLVAGSKGSLQLAVTAPRCEATAALVRGTVPLVVTGGAGSLAGATGGGTLTIGRYWGVQVGCCGRAEGELVLNVNAPNATFDVTPPVLKGAVSKTVRARKKARRVRVRFSVTAQDAVDGPVSAACKPRSGSRFKIGRTKVVCSATDSSANTGRAQFTVTVKRARA